MNSFKVLTIMAATSAFVGMAVADDVAVTQEDAGETAVVSNEEVLYKFFYDIEDLLVAGKTNEATAAFAAALENKQICEAQPRIFLNYISYLCFIDQAAEAEELYLNKLRTDEELASAGFEIIYSNYLYKNQPEKALQWAKILVDQPISLGLREMAFRWVVESLKATNSYEEIIALFDKYSNVFSANAIAQNVCSIIMSFEKQSDIPLIDKFSEVLAKLEQDNNWVVTGNHVVELHKNYINAQWDVINMLIPEALKFVDDSIMQQELIKFVRKTKATGKLDTAEMLLFTVIMEISPDTYPRTRMYAAREWVGIPVLKQDISWYPARLAKLKKMGYAPRELYRIYSTYFFNIVSDTKVLTEVCKFGEALLPLLAADDEGLANLLRTNLLDGYFLIKDYDKVIAMLEEGIPERDEKWIKMTIAKTKADRAYDAKNFDEAIAQYSLFIELLLAGEEETMPDPTSDIVYTKDSIAGKNYKRIADIQKEAGKSAEEIAVSIAKAKEAFTKAKEANTYGKATADYIDQCLSELK